MWSHHEEGNWKKKNVIPAALRILMGDLGRQEAAVETGKQAAEGHHALSPPSFFGLGERKNKTKKICQKRMAP